MHAGLGGLREGFTRNAFRFMVVSPWIGVRILLAALSMALWLPALVWLSIHEHWVLAAIFALVPSVLLRSWYQSSLGALLAPFGIYRMLPILGRGMVAAFTGSPVEWKGRTI